MFFFNLKNLEKSFVNLNVLENLEKWSSWTFFLLRNFGKMVMDDLFFSVTLEILCALPFFLVNFGNVVCVDFFFFRELWKCCVR